MNYNKEDIIESHNRISKWIHRTPILKSSSINKIAGAEIYFKCENFQKIGAFKMRGALNAVMSTKKQNLKKGFVTHSSGNHAQAVALSSNIAKTKAYRARKRTNTLISEYHCRFCGLFHIGHVGRKY